MLIQHVVSVATASVYVPGEAITAKTLTLDSLPSSFVPTALLLRRHDDNGSSNLDKNSATQAESRTGATSRHLSAIESTAASINRIVAGDDGADFAAYVNGESHANPYTYVHICKYAGIGGYVGICRLHAKC